MTAKYLYIYAGLATRGLWKYPVLRIVGEITPKGREWIKTATVTPTHFLAPANENQRASGLPRLCWGGLVSFKGAQRNISSLRGDMVPHFVGFGLVLAFGWGFLYGAPSSRLVRFVLPVCFFLFRQGIANELGVREKLVAHA